MIKTIQGIIKTAISWKTKKWHKLYDKQKEEMLQFIRKNKIPPVIQINGINQLITSDIHRYSS